MPRIVKDVWLEVINTARAELVDTERDPRKRARMQRILADLEKLARHHKYVPRRLVAPPAESGLTEAETNRRIGLRLIEMREFRGLTQPELARRVGLNHRSISDYESGKHAIYLSFIMAKLAPALNCHPEEFLKAPGSGQPATPRRK